MPSRPNNRTSALILDTAEKLMLQDGYNGVSIDTIIAACGISKGTFFYHFKTKEILANTMVDRFIQRRGTAIRSLMDQCERASGNDFDTLIGFLEAFATLKHESENGCLLAAFSYQPLCESHEIGTLYQRAIAGWVDYFHPYIERAFQLKGISNTIPVDVFSKMLFCLMEGAFIIEKMQHHDEMAIQFQCLATLLKSVGDKHS